ncbi:MAG TPA: SPOR domain-containing protein [Allosphingosinicella sp.]|jgi:cell division septation protein DedD
MNRPGLKSLLAPAAAAALLLGAGAAFADVQSGIDLWQAGNYAGAVKEWRALAEKGDANAQFNLGQAYKIGRGVPVDLGSAQSWYEKAAAKGHKQAQANLGLILFQNGDKVKALPWIRKAAEEGDPRAQYVLGTALFNGDIAGKDWPRAYALMQLAAAQGLPPAVANLQQMDQYIPLPERQKGLALAKQMGRAATPVKAVAAAPAPASAKRPSPGPVARTAVPPSIAATPARPTQIGNGWRVQLGAFSNAANAKRAWAGLRAKAGYLAALQPAFVPAGAVTRLQAGPLPNRAAADRACAAAKAAGSACFAVAP